LAALLSVPAFESAACAQVGSGPRAEVVMTTRDGSAEEATESEEPDSASFGGPLRERAKLTGDWLGRRSSLRESGVTLDANAAQFYQGVAAGGVQQAFQFGGRNDYFLNLDAEKLGLWEGAAVTLHAETRYGETVNTVAGTLLAPNLMLALPQSSGSVTALTGVTFTQSMSDEFELFC